MGSNEEVKEIEKPSIEQIEEWVWEEGGCYTPCGCFVEPDGTCHHGHRSWALILGVL